MAQGHFGFVEYAINGMLSPEVGQEETLNSNGLGL